MRRLLILIGLCTLLVSLSVVEADQVCWQMQDGMGQPIVDVLRLSAEPSAGTHPLIYKLNGGLNAFPLYQLIGAGSATQDLLTPLPFDPRFRIGLTMTHDDLHVFGDNRTCSLIARLVSNDADANFLNGLWSLECPGATPFTASGLLVHLNVCPPFFPFDDALLAAQISQFGEVRAVGLGNFVMLPTAP